MIGGAAVSFLAIAGALIALGVASPSLLEGGTTQLARPPAPTTQAKSSPPATPSVPAQSAHQIALAQTREKRDRWLSTFVNDHSPGVYGCTSQTPHADTLASLRCSYRGMSVAYRRFRSTAL